MFERTYSLQELEAKRGQYRAYAWVLYGVMMLFFLAFTFWWWVFFSDYLGLDPSISFYPWIAVTAAVFIGLNEAASHFKGLSNAGDILPVFRGVAQSVETSFPGKARLRLANALSEASVQYEPGGQYTPASYRVTFRPAGGLTGSLEAERGARLGIRTKTTLLAEGVIGEWWKRNEDRFKAVPVFKSITINKDDSRLIELDLWDALLHSERGDLEACVTLLLQMLEETRA